ncbi:MAG: Cna B-type domain-containing protein [Atopobiaceae bacterium]|nr:Cna B-type domain-containing protein [Atopobiaceae bacterium]
MEQSRKTRIKGGLFALLAVLAVAFGLAIGPLSASAQDGSWRIKADKDAPYTDEVAFSIDNRPAYCAEYRVDKIPTINGDIYQHRYDNANDYEANSQERDESTSWLNGENHWDKIRAVLYAGYPHDRVGIGASYRDTAAAIWHYTNDHPAYPDDTNKMNQLIDWAEAHASEVPSSAKLYFYTKDTDYYQWQSVFQLEVDDTPTPSITNTTASAGDATATESAPAAVTIQQGDQLIITDAVYFENLAAGTTYVITSQLWSNDEVQQTKTTEVTSASTSPVTVTFDAVTPTNNQQFNIRTTLKEQGGEQEIVHNDSRNIMSERVTVTVEEPPTPPTPPTPSKSEVSFIKVDENGDPMVGAMLHVEDTNGNTVVEQWTSTTEAKVCQLAAGTYYPVEDEAPEGYVRAERKQFTVEAGEVYASPTNGQVGQLNNVADTGFLSDLDWSEGHAEAGYVPLNWSPKKTSPISIPAYCIDKQAGSPEGGHVNMSDMVMLGSIQSDAVKYHPNDPAATGTADQILRILFVGASGDGKNYSADLGEASAQRTNLMKRGTQLAIWKITNNVDPVYRADDTDAFKAYVNKLIAAADDTSIVLPERYEARIGYEGAEGNNQPVVVATFPSGTSSSSSTPVEVSLANQPEKISITATKKWVDTDGETAVNAPEGASVRFELYKKVGAEDVYVDGATLSQSYGWTVTFRDLPKANANGLITYTVRESAFTGEGFTKGSVTGDAENGFVVTNIKNAPQTTSISVIKAWSDNNNQDGIRPASVTVRLLANDDPTGATLVLNEANGWQGSFADLPMTDDQGNAITYKVTEDAVSGYSMTSAVEGTAVTITNTHTPETITVSGSKTWSDSANQDGRRPASITIRLHADGTEVDSKTVTSADQWSWSFTGLPRYAGGNEIVYTITEDAVDDYSSEVRGYNVNNTYTPGKTSLSVEKVWNDANDQDGIRPASVTIRLLADGADTGKTVTLNESNNWEATFSGLDEYNNGQRIVYTVAEDAPAGYTVSITGDARTGFTVTNTHTPEEPQEFPVSINKTDLGGTELEGAQIVVYDADGNTIASWTSAAGETCDLNLTAGTYSFKETVAPAGYQQVTTEIFFTVDAEGNVTVTTTTVDNGGEVSVTEGIITLADAPVPEEPQDVTINISKTDMDGVEVSGAHIVVRDSEGNVVEEWDSTTETHAVTVQPGDYTLEETVAPTGFKRVETTISFTVAEDGSVTVNTTEVVNGLVEVAADGTLILKDEPEAPENPYVQIRKTDAASTEELAGAKLTLTDAEGNVVDSWTSDGSAHVIQLAPGTYTLTEDQAPVGYNIAESITFQVDENGVVGEPVEMKDAPYVEVSFTKKALGGDELEGATIQILDKDGNVVEQWTSTTEPHRISLPDGNYVMHEEAAPEGYYVATDIPFTVKSGDASATTSVNMDDRRWGEVTISKTDAATSEELPGATLIIKKGDTEIARWESTTEPHKIRLEAGTYTLTEITAPNGYNVAETITFEVNEDGLVEGEKVEMKDHPYTEVTFTKSDLGGKEVVGAKIQILQDGKVIDEWTSTTEAHKIELPDGNYVMHEEAAPHGYFVATDIPFTVKAGSATNTTKVNMTDDAWPTVEISKTSTTDTAELPGAKLIITKKGTDEVVAQHTSTNEPWKIQLEPGEYTLTEVTAPNGYQVAESIDFTVDVNGLVGSDKVHMQDAPVPPEEPDEGEPDNPNKPSRTTKTGNFDFIFNKLLDGKAATSAGQFSFDLIGTGLADGINLSATNDAQGRIVFKDLGLKLTQPGHYTFTLSEIVPEDTKGIVYDKAVYTLHVNVYRRGGELNYECWVTTDKDVELELIDYKFENTTEPEEPTDTPNPEKPNNDTPANPNQQNNTNPGNVTSGSSYNTATRTATTGAARTATAKTGDATNLALMGGMLAAGLLVLVAARKVREN